MLPMWGSFPDWISALVAVVAALAAFFSFVRTRNLSRQRDASQVDAWLGYDREPEDASRRFTLVLTNFSGAPITNVSVRLATFDAQAGDHRVVEFTAPSEGGAWFKLPAGHYWTKPRSFGSTHWEFPESMQESDLPRFRPYASTEKHQVLSFTFTDSNGMRWTRSRLSPAEWCTSW